EMNQTAHISLHSPNFQKAEDKNSSGASEVFRQRCRFPILFRVFRVCFQRPFRRVPQRLRFGEAVSRGIRREPQEEKTRADKNSSQEAAIFSHVLDKQRYFLRKASFADLFTACCGLWPAHHDILREG
ncbi:hypothetical protein, partial [Pararhodobacter sp.]|uniref:hypothetical protein n=1 Tax=Pararhodobacter sp. TaxID=2127056 RepID=UPI002AFFB9A9